MNVFRLAVLEIARQGIWASLTGGWCYEPNNSIFCNTIHLYIWCTLLVLPLLLGIVGAGSGGFSLGLFLAYVGFIAALFLILKLVVSYLHNVFDTVEPIITVKTKKSASGEQTCRSPVSSFSARATESNVIEMIDLAAERSRNRQAVIGSVRTGSLNVVEHGDNVAGNDRHKHHHVRIDDPGSSTTAPAETGEAEFLSEGFPAKMSSIFEDDKSSFTSSGDSTNELLRYGGTSAAKPFLLPTDSLELLPIASSNRKPNSEGTLRRTISSTRRKYSDPNSEFISIKKFNVQRRRSEERPFVRGRLSSNSETRIHSTRSEDRATLRTASTTQNGNWRKSSSGARKAFLVGQVKSGSSGILVDELAMNKANSMENWLENLPRNSPREVQEDNCSTCHSTGRLNDTKKAEKSMADAERQKTASKSASISECCSDNEPSPHASTAVKRHSSTAMQPSNRKISLHRTVGRLSGDSTVAGPSSKVGDLKGQITKFLEELIEKHPETLDAIENVRMNRLGHHSQPQQPAVASSSSAIDNDSIGSAQPANIYNLNLRDSTHVAYDHEDTTQGAIHSFQDEFGNWWTYSFDDQSVGTAQALGSSRAIYEMFSRRRSSGNNSSSSTQKHGRRSRLTVPNPSSQAPEEPSTSSSVMLKLGTAKESAGTPATITLNTIEAAQEQEEMLPSTSQQPTTVNIVVEAKRGASHVQSSHHRRHSSSTSSSSEDGGGHSSRYISNAPTSIFHPMGGVSFTPSHQTGTSSTGTPEAGHRRHQSDSAGSRQFISFMNIASRLYNQASSGGVLYPGLTSNPSSNIPSALALVAAGSSTNQQGFTPFTVLAGSRSSVGGRFDSNTAANNFHNFEQLRRLANDPFGRHPLPDGGGDTLMTIDGAAALPVHHPAAAQTPSLSSVTQSVRVFNDLQARGAAATGIGGGHSGVRAVPLPNKTKIKYYYKLKPFPNLYIGEGWKVKLDRLSVGALFDRNNFFMSGMVDVLLATLVSFLAAAIIFKNVYADFSLLVFAFVVAGSQFSLLKSVQPDAASPVHGYNWLVAYSRPAYFCLFAIIILLHDLVLFIDKTSSPTEPAQEIGWYVNPGWLRLYSTTGIFFSIKDIFTTGLLLLPLAFTIGLLPQAYGITNVIHGNQNGHAYLIQAYYFVLSGRAKLQQID